VGAAIPRRLTDRDLADAAEQGKIGEVQSIWSQELPNLKRIIARSGTAVIGISQVRAEIGKMGNGPTTKPQGGNAWKFYASVRLELRRVQYEQAKEMNNLTHKVEDKVSGCVVKVKAVKCKMSRSQGREEIFYLRGGQGIDNIRSILEIAIAHGMVKKSTGGWLTWVKPDGSSVKVQGIDKLRNHMVEVKADYALLESMVKPVLGSGQSAKQFVEEEGHEPVFGEDEAPGDLMGEVSGLLDD
jgi:recombination protein RecA